LTSGVRPIKRPVSLRCNGAARGSTYREDFMSLRILASTICVFLLTAASSAFAVTFDCDGFAQIFGAHEHMVGVSYKIESGNKFVLYSKVVYPNSKWREEGKFKVLVDNQMETTYALPGTQIFMKQYKFDSPQTNTFVNTLELVDASSFVSMSCKAE
jgi:hypothetical protein